jgi:hypothetical protein
MNTLEHVKNDYRSIPPLRKLLFLALWITPVSLIMAYFILRFYKEAGGILSDVGFILILPIALVGLSRSYIPSLLFWPTFIVLQFGYILIAIYIYYFIKLIMHRKL